MTQMTGLNSWMKIQNFFLGMTIISTINSNVLGWIGFLEFS